MSDEEVTQTTLRDTIEQVYDEHVEKPVSPPQPSSGGAPDAGPTADGTAAPRDGSVAEPEKPGRTAGRARDEHGRLLPGKADPAAKAAPSEPVAPVEPAKPRPPRPSSWKKDYWDHWEKLDPKLAEYINQREGEYAKGVSTYKQEWEQAKPLIDAVAPFLPVLQQHGIKADQWITNLGRAHHMLAMGSGQDKLQMFAKLAQDYGVPLQALYDPQVAQQFVQSTVRQQPVQQQVPVEKLVEQKWMELQTQQDIKQFEAAKDGAGNPLYPHFEAVRVTMGQLLDAGVAKDLPSAYDKALRMHDDLWQAEQDAKRKADEASRLEANRKAVAAAKANAVSTKSATPAGAVAGANKGLRSVIADAVDQHTGGRV